MSWGFWLLVIGGGWVAVSLPVAILAGKAIRRADELGRCRSEDDVLVWARIRPPNKT